MRVKPVYWIILGLALALTVAVIDGLRLRDIRNYAFLAQIFLEGREKV